MSCVAILEKVRQGVSRPPPQRPELSKRQLDTLRLICEDLPNKEVGQRLFLAKKTVEKHRMALNRIAQVHSPIGLYKWAIAHGYVEPPARLDK